MNSKIKILLIGLAGVCAVALVIAFQLNTVNKTLRFQFDQKEQEFSQVKDDLTKKLSTIGEAKRKLEKDIEALRAEMQGISQDRDDLKGKLDEINKEKDSLVGKVQELSKKRVELEEALEKAAEEAKKAVETASASPAAAPAAATATDDAYWAGVLKDKAALEIEVRTLRSQVTDLKLKAEKAMEEGRKLDLQLRTVAEERNDLSRKLIYNEKLAETLSEDLVREKRDKKSITTQMENMRSDNFELKSRLMALGDKKVSLEGKLVDLQQEREVLSKRLGELDQILQDRVDQIIQVKDDLKAARTEAKAAEAKDARVVQLQPIVVKAQSETPMKKMSGSGQVLAINEDNNFVIIDIGEDRGAKVGQIFTLYRNNMKIATVEVIQTRKEISAADIKNLMPGSKVKIGDSVS